MSRSRLTLGLAITLTACGPSMLLGDGAPNPDGGSNGDGGSLETGPTRECRTPAPARPNTGDCDNPCACAERDPPDFGCAQSGRPSAASTDAQREGLTRANYWRTAAGLAPFDAQAQIEQAAQAHAHFMATTAQRTCWPGVHNEVMAGCTGFTGISPGDRMATAGYQFSNWAEVINWEPTPSASVDGWIWTVYHRQPFMAWRLNEEGFGVEMGPFGTRTASHDVMDFGTPRAGGGTAPPAPIVFPPPGLRDVPPAFRGDFEGPTPPAPAGGRWPSGTVISVHFPSNGWTIASHELFLAPACTAVPHTFNTFMNDANLSRSGPSNDVFMYANTALQPSTEYVVRVNGMWNGQPWGRTWAFTTRSR